VGLSKLQLNTTEINFTDNRALSGDSAYPTSCDEACLNRSIVGVNNETLKNGPLVKHIHTDPAVCIDDDNVTNCETYFVNNIMLGQEIIMVPVYWAIMINLLVQHNFKLGSNDDDHTINGSKNVLILCNE